MIAAPPARIDLPPQAPPLPPQASPRAVASGRPGAVTIAHEGTRFEEFFRRLPSRASWPNGMPTGPSGIFTQPTRCSRRLPRSILPPAPPWETRRQQWAEARLAAMRQQRADREDEVRKTLAHGCRARRLETRAGGRAPPGHQLRRWRPPGRYPYPLPFGGKQRSPRDSVASAVRAALRDSSVAAQALELRRQLAAEQAKRDALRRQHDHLGKAYAQAIDTGLPETIRVAAVAKIEQQSCAEAISVSTLRIGELERKIQDGQLQLEGPVDIAVRAHLRKLADDAFKEFERLALEAAQAARQAAEPILGQAAPWAKLRKRLSPRTCQPGRLKSISPSP